MKTKKIYLEIIPIILFAILFCATNIIMNNHDPVASNYINNINKHIEELDLKKGGSWVGIDPIYINDTDPNFDWAKTKLDNAWCTGEGTAAKPYLIENVTIDASGASSGIKIVDSGAHFVIRNCTIYNATDNRAAIELANAANGTITENRLSNSTYGVKISFNTRDIVIENNNVTGCGSYGVYVWNSRNITVSENKLSGNYQGGIYFLYGHNGTVSGNTVESSIDGISLTLSDNNTLKDNLMRNCGINLAGTMSGNDIDTSNKVNGKPVYYYENRTRLGGGDFSDAGQVILANCNDSIISGLNVSRGTVGVLVTGLSHNNSIEGNTASDNRRYGVYLGSSYLNNITDNTLAGNSYGLYFGFGSVWNRAERNNVSGNIHGIDMRFSLNTVFNNTLKDNSYGIRLSEDADNNTVELNNLTNNVHGLYLDGCDYNNFTDNAIEDNTLYGVYIDQGAYTSNNRFYGNRFIGNGMHARIDDENHNQWDNGSVGNYWDDYWAYDNDGDGIGDEPHKFVVAAGTPWPDEDCYDYYPIWDIADSVAPIIYILSPDPGAPDPDILFGEDAPNFSLYIDEYDLNETWYCLINGTDTTDNETFTYVYDTPAPILEEIWDSLGNGTVMLCFFANDSRGNEGSRNVTVYKDVLAPLLAIMLPLNESTHGSDAPQLNFTVAEPHLDKLWYTINGNKSYFAENGTLDPTLWDWLEDETYTITFYANDTVGNEYFIQLTITKDTGQGGNGGVAPPPDDDNDNSNDENGGKENSFFFLALGIGAIGGGIAIASLTFFLKKRKGKF